MGETELTGHARHVAAAVALRVVEYCPAVQLVHDALPDAILYDPTGHAVQGPPFGPVNPGVQVQPVKTVHPRHAAPEFDGHARQGPRFGPYDATLQEQFANTVHPIPESPRSCGHAVHVLMVVACTCAE